VLDRIRSVPRHLFMDEALASRAYEDTALPIGFGQTISQPFVVAKMTEALLAAGDAPRVLEIGTGCGYQTAVLSPLVAEIYSLERIAPLLARARRTLRELRIRNVNFRHDDGNIGWAARAPFDGILLTAAPHTVPQALFEQLKTGGRLIAPVGPEGKQELFRYTKGETRIDRQSLGAVSFVPLVSGLQR
jgi:protein-L-isoaspartate(D-aspartate) O-methyltransferase